MTYLELINGVLKRLRETEVTTANETTYSAMIGEFINDAKKEIELAAQWTGLRTTLTVATAVGTQSYTMTGAYQNSIIKTAMSDTENRLLTRRPRVWWNQKTILNDATSSKVSDYVLDGVDATGQLKILVFPTPDSIEQLKFDMVIPQADLSSDATVMTIPSNPVLQLAFALALRERGETDGVSYQEQMRIADRALQDAISIDANKYPEEQDFYRI